MVPKMSMELRQFIVVAELTNEVDSQKRPKAVLNEKGPCASCAGAFLKLMSSGKIE